MSELMSFTGASNVVTEVSSATPLPITGSVSIGGGGLSLVPSSGQVSVLAGPTQAPLSGVAAQKDEVIVIAKLTNVGNIFLGPTGVTSANGMIMEPGRGISLQNVDLATIFINGTAGDGVSFFALT